MDKIKRIQQLVSQLNTYRNEYYNQNNPEVSDKQYDNLFDELNNLESETGYVPSNSPTQNVGYAVLDKLPKFKHTYPLLSLAKTTDVEDFADFTKGKDGDLMLKMDGLTGELIYEDGMLVRLNNKGIKFALSNNLIMNITLQDWAEQNQFNIHYLNSTYSNCNYQKKDKITKDIEVLITNY
jgi:hypothetical protein